MKFIILCLLVSMSTRSMDTIIDEPNYFIAMEYKGLSNCIYKVFITDSLILGAKVNGYITVQPNFGAGKVIPKNVMHSPEAYVDKAVDAKYKNLLFDEGRFLAADKENFIIRKTAIKKIYHNPKPKCQIKTLKYRHKLIQ